MAIGIRISSDNLSGMTANVTFLPTSGGTVDLGTQTIPFNYLTTDPFGVYEVYIPTYDYTYELTAKASVFSGESFSFVSRLTTNYDNGSVTLNFNDFTAEIIDLGVDYAGWRITDLYPLTNSGYGYYFYNDNDSCWRWVVFTDVFGNIIDQYQAFTDCDDDWDDLGGKWLTFVDNLNGVFKYFNGQNCYTYTFESNNYNLRVETGWDGVMSNDSFVISIQNYSAATKTNYIVNSGVLTQIGTPFNTNDFYQNIAIYFSGDFICRLLFDQSLNSIIDLDIYDGIDGTLITNLNFPSGQYNFYNLNFYGDNKMILLSYSDSNYRLVHFNGDTRVMKTLNHDKINYGNFDIRTNTNLYPNDGPSEAFAIAVFNQDGGGNIGRLVTYCDIIYMLSGDTDFTTYTFQNSGIPDKEIRTWNMSANNSIYAMCNNGDGNFSTLCITPSGQTYVNSNISSNTDAYSYIVGDNYVTIVFTDTNYTGATLTHISKYGVVLDNISGITFSSSYNFRVENVGNVFVFTNYSDVSVYLNPTSPTFQNAGSLSNLDYFYTPGSQFKPDFLRQGTILSVNDTTKYSSLLTSAGYMTGSTLPQSSSSSYSIKVGDNKFMYVYYDINGYVNIELYDFEFTLLNSQVTPHTSWWTTNSCGNRFYTVINQNSQYIVYLISDSEITSKTLTDDNDYYTPNDYVNWN